MLRNSRKYMRKHGIVADLIQADLRALPVATASFDYAVAVASYHHVEGHEQRLAAFRELRRILRPCGEAYLTVWNHGQPRFKDGPQDLLVPWKSGSKTFQRYYYLYHYEELEGDLKDAGLDVVKLEPERRHAGTDSRASQNICALVRRQD